MDKNLDIDLDEMLLAIEVIKQYEGKEFVKKAQKIIDGTLDYLWKRCEKATSDSTERVKLDAFSSLVVCHGALRTMTDLQVKKGEEMAEMYKGISGYT